jgi:outer membrane protein assembly factor BamB
MPRLLSLLALFVFAAAARADDWPQWLGPHRDGATPDKVAPWKGELKIAWRKPVAEGHSSPVVVGDKVYLHTFKKKDGKEVEQIECRNTKTGDSVWTFDYPRPAFQGLFGNGPRATPAIAGGKLYAYGATGILTSLDATKGDKIWQVDTKKELSPPGLKFGVSSSPIVVGDKVIVEVGGKGKSIVAFDAAKGTIAWKSGDAPASYSSPILFGPDKAPTLVCLTQKGVVGLQPEDGKELWSFPFEDTAFESSTTPVRVGDKLLVSSITLGSALLTLEQSDGKTTAKKDWFKSELTCYFSTPVPVGTAQVYLVAGTFLGNATLHCVDAKNGKSLWSKAGVGKYHACLVRTGDDKLLMMEETGSLVLLEPNPQKYQELARQKICGETWAHPAVANGRLYIRDEKELICVELAQ